LINISRGSVIDENALIEALEQNLIAGAGLDVYEDEPHIPERLLALNNAVLLPHLASATHETRQAMADLVMDNLRTFFSTGQVKVAVP
jgi:hydroxypyruvate reductase